MSLKMRVVIMRCKCYVVVNPCVFTVFVYRFYISLKKGTAHIKTVMKDIIRLELNFLPLVNMSLLNEARLHLLQLPFQAAIFIGFLYVFM